MNLRRSVLAFTLAASLLVSALPKKSEAGLVLGAMVGAPRTGMLLGAIVGVSLYGGVIVIFDGRYHDSFFVFGGAGALGMTLLDVEATMPTDQLANGLKKAFPFIDNSEVLMNIATAAKTKFKERTLVSPSAQDVTINFSQDEVTELLSATDLSLDQVEYVVEALK